MTDTVSLPLTEPRPAPRPPAVVPPLLRIDEVRVQFERLRAVDDVTLHLPAGALLGMIGPNGAGKTTLLRAVAGLQPLTRGQVRIMEHRVEPGNTDALRHIGFTPDTPWVYDDLTVRQFLRFIARSYNLDPGEGEERIDFWLEKVWLTEKADQKIKALSRGMKQRVGIARTLLPNPAVVLLDEPAAGLDPAGRVQFRQLLVNLREQGKTLIVSSHILADMSEYCTHIGIMAHGSLLQFGTVAEIAHGTVGARCLYRVALARPIAGTKDVQTVEGIAGVTGVQADGSRLSLEFNNTPDDAAELLSQLIKLGLPVSSFTAETGGLEAAYLRTGIRQVD